MGERARERERDRHEGEDEGEGEGEGEDYKGKGKELCSCSTPAEYVWRCGCTLPHAPRSTTPSKTASLAPPFR